MRAALEGALFGGGLALLLLTFEYLVIRRAMRLRSRRSDGVLEMQPSERRRLYALASFCAALPFAFAFFFWLIWG